MIAEPVERRVIEAEGEELWAAVRDQVDIEDGWVEDYGGWERASRLMTHEVKVDVTGYDEWPTTARVEHGKLSHVTLTLEKVVEVRGRKLAIYGVDW